MADVNSQVALGIQAPDPNQGMNTLSKILSIGQQGLQIQGQKSKNQSLAADAAIGQQNAKEKMAGAQLLSDPVGNGLIDADGNPTKDAQRIIYQAMPTTGADHYQGILNGAKSKVDFNKAANGLSSDIRNEAVGVLAATSADPKVSKEQADEQANAYVESKKGTPVYDNVKKVVDTAQTIAQHLQDQQDKTGQIIPAGQEAWRNGYATAGRTALGATAVVGANGIAAPTAGVQNLGETNQPIVQAPALQGGGVTTAPGATKNTIPPGYQMLNGQLVKISNGGISLPDVTPPHPPGGPPAAPAGVAPGPGMRPRTAGDDAPKLNSPQAVLDAYQASVKKASADVQTARDADKDYGTNVHVSNVIRNLSKDTHTGPGSGIWHSMLASVSPESGNAGSDYQTISAMLDRQAAMARQTMGLPDTNAGVGTAQSITGTTQYSGPALNTKNNLTQALVEGSHQFRQGLEKVGGFTTEPSPNAVNAYKQAWTSNFDPNVYRAMRAHDENDVAEQKQLQKELGPAGFKALAVKARNLESLSNTGALPPQQK